MKSTEPLIGVRRRWLILLASMSAAVVTTATTNGIAYLIPAMHANGASLQSASTIAALPTVGLMLGIVGWGFAIDRFGERRVLLLSGVLTAAFTIAATAISGAGASLPAVGGLLLLAGLSCGAANGASGRLVVGWFPPRHRGTAMGIRQTAQPLGIALCSLSMPVIADAFSVTAALAVPATVAVVALAAVAVVVVDPPRPPRTSDGQRPLNPYRHNTFLLRIHAVSILLVIPQSLLWTFAPTWLMVTHHWSPAAAGALITVGQLLGAAGRIAAGRWSDVWESRMRPIRVIACAATLSMLTLAAADSAGWMGIAVAVMVLATVITVADNGLAFTAIAEYAGAAWSGRALAVQNTGQYLATAALAPPVGAAIIPWGFPAIFAIVSIAPAVAAVVVPKDAAPATADANS